MVGKNKVDFLELADHSNINTTNFNDETMMTIRMETEEELKEIGVIQKPAVNKRFVKGFVVIILICIAFVLITTLPKPPDEVCP